MTRAVGWLVGLAACGPASEVDGAALAERRGGCTSVHQGPVTRTTQGCVEGAETASGAAVAFLGIPYAAPPVGSLRFAPPEPATAWSGTRDARIIGSPCLQSTGTVDGTLAAGDGDEDCLFLNIWRPNDRRGDLPVLFFIHGGGYVNGSGAQPVLADDPALAQAAVVVSHNYRLGPLGFFGHPALSAADPDGVSGNQGLRDSLLALRWIRDNAAAFGGDPDKILVFGESAGGLSTCALYAMPAADGLFHAALVQSAPCDNVARPLRGGPGPAGVDAVEDQGLRLSAALGCDTAADELACLRAAPAEDLLFALAARVGPTGAGESWDAAIDGSLLPVPFAAAEAAGVLSTRPLYAGANADEGTLFVQGAITDLGYRLVLATYAPALGTTAAVLYDTWHPADFGGDVGAAFQAFYGDAIFVCPTRQMLHRLAPGRPVHGYFWGRDYLGVANLGPFTGAFHGAELGYVFGTLGLAGAADRDLAARAQALWTSAATDGAAWPTLDAGWTHVRGDASVGLRPDVRADRCDVVFPLP